MYPYVYYTNKLSYKYYTCDCAECEDVRVEYSKWTDGGALVVEAMSLVGIVATLFTIVVFVLHNNTYYIIPEFSVPIKCQFLRQCRLLFISYD